MHRTRPFDQYISLAHEELDLPLHDVIQNLNWLILNALGDSSRIAIFMEKYEQVFNFIGLNCHDVGMCSNALKNYFDGMFDEIASYPISICPMAMINNWELPSFIRETWSVITASQLMLPILVNAKKVMERTSGDRVQNTIIICIIERYFRDKFPDGFACIDDIVTQHVNTVAKDDKSIPTDLFKVVEADVLLGGFTRISLLPTHHLNMLDVPYIVNSVVGKHPAIRPAVLPPTNMF